MQKESLVFDIAKTNELCFISYGVKIRIEVSDKNHLQMILENLPIILPNKFKFIDIDADEVDFHFYLTKTDENIFEIYKNRELYNTGGRYEQAFINFFLSHMRLTIAENAVSRVFIHAGVVAWNGEAIIFPANSYGGKTTLVSEFVKNGAEYYSDEYAIIDGEGLIHPFPKMLSVRGIIDADVQKDIPVERFGGKAGTEPIPVGLVLFTEFEKDAQWNPEVLTTGQGIMEILSHTIPIRYNPEFSLEVLNKTLNRAIIAKSKRGEASEFVKYILKFIEK